MEASHFDEREFFRAISTSGVRALLIGRRAEDIRLLEALRGKGAP